MHPSCVNVLNIYTVLRNSQKTTRDFQRFRLRFWCRNGQFFFVSANFDIAASYIYSLGTVSVTVVTRILVSASTESLSNSLSLLQFLLRLYSKLASSQWPSVTPDSLVSFFLQQGFCADPRKQGHSGPLFSTLKISFDLSTGWAEYRLGVELAHFVASAHCCDIFVFFC